MEITPVTVEANIQMGVAAEPSISRAVEWILRSSPSAYVHRCLTLQNTYCEMSKVATSVGAHKYSLSSLGPYSSFTKYTRYLFTLRSVSNSSKYHSLLLFRLSPTLEIQYVMIMKRSNALRH